MSCFPEESTIWLEPIELKYLREKTVWRILDKILNGRGGGEYLEAKSGYLKGEIIGRSSYYVRTDKERNLTIVEACVCASGNFDPRKEFQYCNEALARAKRELEWWYNRKKREDLDSELRELVEKGIKVWEEKKEKAMNWYQEVENYISDLNDLLYRTRRTLEKLKEIDNEIDRGSFKSLIEYVGEDYVKERLKEIFLKK
jgi:hypothetical protein